MAHKVYGLIVKVIKDGKLVEPFNMNDFRKACPGLKEGTYGTFLPKHRKGKSGADSKLFERVASGKYKVIRPFKYGFNY